MAERRAYVVGVATAPLSKSLGKPAREAFVEVFRQALADAGLTKDRVDGLFVAPPGFTGPPSFMFAAHMGHYLGLTTKSLTMVENGGATSALALRYAMCEVLSGRVQVAAVVAIDIRADEVLRELGGTGGDPFREGVFIQTGLYGPYHAPYGVGAPIPYYAMSGRRYMDEHRLSAEEVAEVAVALRRNATRNPLALYRDPVTVEEVVQSRMVSPPLTLLMCSPFCAGAAAVIVAGEETARDCARAGSDRRPGDGGHQPSSGGHQPIAITGYGEHHHPSHFSPEFGEMTSFESVREAGAEAFREAGRKPSEVDVAEVYGVFAPTELILLEDLGLCERGEAARAFAEGKLSPEGDLAVDTSGGRLSLGHPAAATPLMEVCEVVWQLRGKAGSRQHPGARVGLVHAEHGMLNGSIVFIMEGE